MGGITRLDIEGLQFYEKRSLAFGEIGKQPGLGGESFKVVGSRRNLAEVRSLPSRLKHLFNSLMVHETDIDEAARPEHCPGGLDVVLRKRGPIPDFRIRNEQ